MSVEKTVTLHCDGYMCDASIETSAALAADARAIARDAGWGSSDGSAVRGKDWCPACMAEWRR